MTPRYAAAAWLMIARMTPRSSSRQGRIMVMNSARAGCGPDIDAALGRIAVDLLELAGRELALVHCGHVLFQLRDAARPDQRRRHDGFTQGPCHRHLGQRL